VPRQPSLALTPSTLTRSVYRGKPTTLTITIQNNGLGTANHLGVTLPNLPFMSLASQLSDMNLEPLSNVNITLSLNPTANNSLLQAYVGNFVVYCDQQSISFPFTIQVVSDLYGNLVVEGTKFKDLLLTSFLVIDEFTYYAAGSPKVAGAQASLSDVLGNSVANATSNSSGYMTFINIPEGFYSFWATAENHTQYKDVVYVYPGTNTSYTAFMSRYCTTR
jgi:hypothetical protein